MSDPLSVSASILTVIGSGYAIAKGLYQIADGIGSAGKEVRVHADGIKAFSDLLQYIRDELLKGPEQSRSRPEQIVTRIVELCERVLEPMNELQAALNPLLERYRQSKTKLLQIIRRIHWLFSAKGKLLFYQEALGRLNGILNTTLSAMKINTTHQEPVILNIQQNSIQIEIAGVRRSLDGPMQLQPTVQQFLLTDERTGNANVQPVDSETVSSEDDTNQQAALQPNNDAVESEDGDNNGSIVNQRDVDDEIQPGRGEIIEVIDIDEEEIFEIDRTINETIDRHFEESAQEIWEEVRVVSRHVLRYAEDVLNTSYEQSQDPQSSPGPQSQNPQSSPGPSSQISQPDQVMQMAVREEPILVKTITGTSYQVPYEAVKNWNDAKPVLASLNHPDLYRPGGYHSTPISEILERGEFELVGPNNGLILPKFWSETVRPGWTIDLQFKNLFWDGKSTRDAYSPHSETITKAHEEKYRGIWSVFKKKR